MVNADTPVCREPRKSTISKIYLTMVEGGMGVTMISNMAIEMPSTAGLPISRNCRSGRLGLCRGAHFWVSKSGKGGGNVRSRAM